MQLPDSPIKGGVKYSIIGMPVFISHSLQHNVNLRFHGDFWLCLKIGYPRILKHHVPHMFTIFPQICPFFHHIFPFDFRVVFPSVSPSVQKMEGSKRIRVTSPAIIHFQSNERNVNVRNNHFQWDSQWEYPQKGFSINNKPWRLPKNRATSPVIIHFNGMFPFRNPPAIGRTPLLSKGPPAAAQRGAAPGAAQRAGAPAGCHHGARGGASENRGKTRGEPWEKLGKTIVQLWCWWIFTDGTFRVQRKLI